MTASLPVLVVDDEAQTLQSLKMTLLSAGIDNVACCQQAEEVLPYLQSHEIEVLLLDLWMPRVSGEEILATVRENFPHIPVIVVTGVDDVDTAVRCMRTGTFDYLVKPVERDSLVAVVRRAIRVRELERENRQLAASVLSSTLNHPEAFAEIVTQNQDMLRIFRYVEAVARTSHPVLITGETGVGKELVARAVHRLSPMRGAFVGLNSAGLDDTVFADTLFGHKRGAFTGADGERVGMIERARGGTLFLDEIGDLSSTSQVKLLRLLQEREFFPLGSDVPKRMEARVVVATNQDLESQQERGAFRKDLFYRLHTHHLRVPPLRERLDDLPILIDHFFSRANKETLGKQQKLEVPKRLVQMLRSYRFPGNVRQLESMIDDAVASHRGGQLSLETFTRTIGQDHPPDEAARSSAARSSASSVFDGPLPTLSQAQEMLVAEAMRRAAGNQTAAARTLGISRQALNRRLRRK